MERITKMGYVDEVLELVSKKNADQPEFLQAVSEVLESLRPVVVLMRSFTEAMLFLKELQSQTEFLCSVFLG